MTTDEFNAAIALLGCKSAKDAANMLGVCARTAQYYAKGKNAKGAPMRIPMPIARLLRSLLDAREREVGAGSAAEIKLASGHL